LEVDVVPINFLKRIDGTPIAKKVDSDLTPMEALSIVSIFRFILPTQELKIAGGREEILRDMQSWMFFAGANSFLIGNYLTTLGRSPSDDHRMLRDLGLSYVTYDEVEHEAKDDDLPSPQAPRSLVGPRVTSQNTVSLPVMNG
jgi:biotin synthase